MHSAIHIAIGSFIPIALVLLGLRYLRSSDQKRRRKTSYVLRVSFWGFLLGFLYVQIALSSGVPSIPEAEVFSEEDLAMDGPNITALWFIFGLIGFVVSISLGMRLIKTSSEN
jgi:hypothetical protein